MWESHGFGRTRVAMAASFSALGSSIKVRLGGVAALQIVLCATIAMASSVHAETFNVDRSQMSGFEILTADDGAMEATNMVVVKYDGDIAPPMATSLRAIWDEVRRRSRFDRFVLRLNSPGGVDTHGVEVIEILAEIRERMTLVTLVAEHDLCASMCIALFVQGETRYASPASAWMFHGASAYPGSPPSLGMTMRYFELFRERNIDESFIGFLFENHYVTKPGTYWLSGSELAGHSNIITNLLPNWKPEKAEHRAGGGILGRI